VAVVVPLVVFGGCAVGLWLADVDAAVALGVAVAPFTVALTVLAWWAARADPQHDSGGQPEAAPPPAGTSAVTVTGGQGAQVGDRNTQRNTFGTLPPPR
jgi:hypothetical protein